MRIIIDTNIFVMTLTSRSPYHVIYQTLVAGEYELLLSNEILLEYQEIIEVKYGKSTADFFIRLLDELPNIHNITPFYNWGVMQNDPDDNKYFDCGIAGQADYLVTEDKHFNILATIDFPKLQVINASAFVELLKIHKTL